MCTVLHPAAAQQRRVPSGVLLCSPGCTSASAGEQQRAAEMAAVRAVQATSIRGTDPAAGVAHSDDEAAVQDGALAAVEAPHRRQLAVYSPPLASCRCSLRGQQDPLLSSCASHRTMSKEHSVLQTQHTRHLAAWQLVCWSH